MAAIKRSTSLILVSLQTTQHEESKEMLNGPKHEIFIGNLNYDCSTRLIISRIQRLFSRINIIVPDFRFTVIQCSSKKNPRKYAFVVLSNETDENEVYQLDGLKNLDIVIEGLPLRVSKRRFRRSKENKRLKVSFDGNRRLLKQSKSEPTLSDLFRQKDINFSMSHYKKELYRGQFLPVEDRVTEYKRGSGNYLKNMLVPHIRKYLCAFLNSEGGRLMIGVADDCKVYGINCNRKQEDLARCQIDNVIKNFQPHVFPNLYLVDFIPVKLGPNDNIVDSIDPLLKVLEVSVNRPQVANSLYENDRGEVYIRRDGSIEGPLKATQIVEWCRVKFTSNYVYSDNSNARNNKNKSILSTDDIVIAKESFSNNFNLLKLEGTININHRRIEEQLQKLREDFVMKEKKIHSELLKSKVELAEAKFEIQSLKVKSSSSFVCTIL